MKAALNEVMQQTRKFFAIITMRISRCQSRGDGWLSFSNFAVAVLLLFVLGVKAFSKLDITIIYMPR